MSGHESNSVSAQQTQSFSTAVIKMESSHYLLFCVFVNGHVSILISKFCVIVAGLFFCLIRRDSSLVAGLVW